MKRSKLHRNKPLGTRRPLTKRGRKPSERERIYGPVADARALLDARDYSIDTHADRVKARRVLARCYADDGWSPPPIDDSLIPERKR